jgi:hypothetical protein
MDRDQRVPLDAKRPTRRVSGQSDSGDRCRWSSVSIAYWWEHPDDGPQDGLVLIGSADEGGSLVAMWGDSWHQKPAPMMLSGSRSTDAALELGGDYGGGWRWRVTFDATDSDSFRMQMDNVIPAEQATAEISPGPYPVMIMQTRRA